MSSEQKKRENYSELDEKLFEMQALFDLSKALNSTLQLKEILDTILLTPMGKYLITKGLVLIEKAAPDKFVIKSLKGLPKSLLEQIVQLSGLPRTAGYTDEIHNPISRAFFAKNEIELILPIVHQNDFLGFVCFNRKIKGTDYSNEELNYLSSLTNIAATSIKNSLIFQELDTAKRQLEKKYQEQNTLFEIERELSSTLSSLQSEKVLNLLAYSIMGEMMVQKCLIFLNENNAMKLSLNKGFQREQMETVLADSHFLENLLQLEKPVIISGTYEESELCKKCSDTGIQVLVPMRTANEAKGVLALGPKITKLEFSTEDLDFLATLGNMSMISIENVRLFEEKLKNQKFEDELRIASDIQKKLLPDTCPVIEGFDIAAVNISSRHVGGDYYDCIRLSDTQYALCIGDVSGKGVPASLLMANLQASLHALVNTGLEISKMIVRINNLIHRNTGIDKFITFFLTILDTREKTLLAVNAGHNPPYVFHKDGTFQTLNAGGLILGMMPDSSYESEKVQLQSGDCIVMYTDGVSEAMNSDEEEFEETRIEKSILSNYQLSAQGILEHLIADVMTFAEGQPQADDITSLIVKVV